MLKNLIVWFGIVGLLFLGSAHVVKSAHGATEEGARDAVMLAQASTCYVTFWPTNDDVVEIDICEYNTGSSGYTVLRNTSWQAIRVCWEFEWNDGTQSSRQCNNHLNPGEESRSSCLSCNRGSQKGGVYTMYWWVEYL